MRNSRLLAVGLFIGLALPFAAFGFIQAIQLTSANTGITTDTAHSILIGQGANAGLTNVGPCNASVPITGQGASADPHCGGVIPVANGGTGGALPVVLLGSAANINCNSLGDNAMPLTLPGTKWRGLILLIYNHGTTASLTAAQVGLFSTTGGGGQALIASGTVLTAITATGIDVAANYTQLAPATMSVVDYTSVQVRVTQVQGAACTIDAYLYGYPIP